MKCELPRGMIITMNNTTCPVSLGPCVLGGPVLSVVMCMPVFGSERGILVVGSGAERCLGRVRARHVVSARAFAAVTLGLVLTTLSFGGARMDVMHSVHGLGPGGVLLYSSGSFV